ncbi:hypothetical protein AK812_SmicGene39958 [Symbiodinium microadriaticum]|uniref:Uncharacterized protein n=1 Tax=Symbiodinium microadriaticum TaxID=2951 RepID=A0A1Q9C9Y3_SYMMI|nr:hypothetical protein AK812_SmicGene39958 [Symbiodinium microadriaticum]
MVEVDEVDAETLEREFPDSHSVLERVWHRGRRLGQEEICDHNEMSNAVIEEETLDEKVQALLDRTEDPLLQEFFREGLGRFRHAPHERAGQADQSGQMEKLLDFFEGYRVDSVNGKGAGEDLLEYAKGLLECN